MTARTIKLAIATVLTAIATVSPEDAQPEAEAVDSTTVIYSAAAAIELHSSTPTLLAWASQLSGYSTPAVSPRIVYRPGRFFHDEVCGGTACKAVGWYNDQNIIYLDEKYRYADQNEFANSLLLHELVHFLQHHSGKFDSLSCDDSLAREREAYAVQNDYLVNVWHSFRFIPPKAVSCAYGSGDD